MWILEGTPNAKAEAARKAAIISGMDKYGMDPAVGSGKMLIAVGQKDLMTYRIRSGIDNNGQGTVEVQFTNYKINGALDPALFKYTPPEGARIFDATTAPPILKATTRKTPK